jgi:tripartite-type tricarboxylate transporter receptor subunit TctC
MLANCPLAFLRWLYLNRFFRERCLSLFSATLVAFCALTATDARSSADDWPSRPVKIVVAYPAGGTVDAVARLVAEKLSGALGQSFYVENRSGGGGIVGTDYVAKSAPDGYTLLMASDIQFTVNPNFDSHLPFSVKDFAPISLAGDFDLILSAHPSLQVSNLSELVARAKQQPGAISYGSYGPNSTHELVMEHLQLLRGFKLTAVPYRGSGEILPDILSGRIQLALFGVPPTLPYVRSGRLKALAVGSLKRLDVLPDVPTIAEQGFPGFEATTYAGLFAPAGTAQDIIAKLQKETVRGVSAPAARERFLATGVTLGGSTPEELAARIEKDFLRWGSVLRAIRRGDTEPEKSKAINQGG